MSVMIRFKKVEIQSNVIFRGKEVKHLNYPVKSLSLVPVMLKPEKKPILESLPEIFLQ